MSCWPESIVTLYNHFPSRLLFLCMSCWLFVCLFVSCWLDTGVTLPKCTANRLLFLSCRLFVCVSYLQDASITLSKCTANRLLFLSCRLFVCVSNLKHHFVKVYSHLLLFVCELLAGDKHRFVKVYSQYTSCLLLFVCLWIVSWTQASICQSVQIIVFFFWVVGCLFVWVTDRTQASLFQSVQSMC